MNKKYLFFSFILMFILCGCGKNVDDKTISIAVTGSPSEYSKYYEKGIKRAYDDVRKEYKDSGFNIECKFYDDKDNYEQAEKITAQLVNDESITAILASSSAEICENQAYQTDTHNKILVCPHWMIDSIIEENNYDKVFSLNYSNKDIGYLMGFITGDIEKKKWAVCYSDDKVGKEEIRGLSYFGNANTVDFVKVNYLMSDFNKVVNRWKALGVDGVVFIPYSNEGFELLYKLKKAMPDITVICDSDMDNDDQLQANRKYFENVYIIDSFYSGSEGMGKIDDEAIDTWEVHGYNAFRIVVDTAIKNNTNDTKKISDILHKDGYKGEYETFKFNEKGAFIPEYLSYAKICSDDVEVYDILIKD